MTSNKQLVLVTDVAFEDNNDLVVKVVGRNSEGQRVGPLQIYGTEPYMFIPKDVEVPDDHRIEEVRETNEDGEAFESYDHRPLKQLIAEYPNQIGNSWQSNKIRDHFDEDDRYEDDLPYNRRAAADYGLAGYIKVPKGQDKLNIDQVENVDTPEEEIEPRTLIVDIETRMPETFDDDFVDDAPKEVTAITAWDSFEDKYTLFALDKENAIDPHEVRDNLKEQWHGDSVTQKDKIKSEVERIYQDHADSQADHLNWDDAEWIRDRVKENLKFIDEVDAYVDHAFDDARTKWDDDNIHEFIRLVKEELTDDGTEIDAERYSEADIGFKRYHDEAQLLEDFVTYVEDLRPDIWSGWNFVDFDLQYLRNRMNQFDVGMGRMAELGDVKMRSHEGAFPGLPGLDLMDAYCETMSYGSWRSKSLDYVSNDQLGLGKIEQATYDGDRSEFMAYNIVDVQLCVGLDRMHGIHEFFFQLSDVCAIPIADVGSSMKMVEGFLFKHRTHKEILPTTQDTEVDSIRGGFVLPPADGISDWIGVFDLKSLYPSTIITCNISKETYTTDPEEADVITPDMPLNYEEVPGKKITPDNIGWDLGEGGCAGFSLEQEGLIPKYLKLLFDERDDFKALRDAYDKKHPAYDTYDMKQRAVKVLMNTFFGVMDNPYFRLSMPGLGEAITGTSRYISWAGTQIIRDEGYELEYGDTDSLLSPLKEWDEDPEELTLEQILDRGHDLVEEINSTIEEFLNPLGLPGEHPFAADLHGTAQHCWVYEFEKVYRRFLQLGAKKRYAGLINWKEGKRTDELDVTGFEVVRTDVPEMTSEVQYDFMEKVLRGRDFEELSDYIRQRAEAIKAEDVDLKKIGKPSSINKPLEEYPNRPTPRACEYANDYLDANWGPGDSPWVVYIDSTPPGMPDTDVLAIDWTDRNLPEGYELDSQEHIENSLHSPIEDTLGELEFTWKELITGNENKSAVGGW